MTNPERETPSLPSGHDGWPVEHSRGDRAYSTSRTGRMRLDVAVVARGLETTRERARRLIVAGEVTVNGHRATAPSTPTPAGAIIEITNPHKYVGRGGLKLAYALDAFSIDPAGRVGVDIGASTGGFTDVMLQRGTARVYAIDVGHGQLAWTLRNDPRVVVMEGVNARFLHGPTPGPAGEQAHPGITMLAEMGSIVTIDVAFISLTLILPAVTRILAPHGDVVALVKPQFEAGASQVGKGGVVRNPAVHRTVLGTVAHAAVGLGLVPQGLIASPVRGQAGNVEFLLWLRSATDNLHPVGTTFEWERAITLALAGPAQDH
ncbi:MAG: TlyA family RNA methyltransferase [Chloroflexi bacterium]|nr:TlyA family RNA methyltransferase [Chloroflexota bacterium]